MRMRLMLLQIDFRLSPNIFAQSFRPFVLVFVKDSILGNWPKYERRRREENRNRKRKRKSKPEAQEIPTHNFWR